MLITFDYVCEDCALVVERTINTGDKDQQKCWRCDGSMKRLPAAPATTFKFNDREGK